MNRSLRSLCGCLLALAPSLHAGFLKEWQVNETASAPVLVTGRITAVHRNERVPDDRLSWKAETWSMTADVEVLRSFPEPRPPPAGRRIEVEYLAYGPSLTSMVCCSPPPLPR